MTLKDGKPIILYVETRTRPRRPMVRRQRVSTNAGIGQLNLDSLTYDQRGKVTKDSRVQAQESVS